MRQITESEINYGGMYLFYIHINNSKEVYVMRILGDKIRIITTTSIAPDLQGNRSIFARVDKSTDTAHVNDISFFNYLQWSGSGLFELTNEETNLVLAEII